MAHEGHVAVRTLLVTGGTGLLGHHVIRAARLAGWRVRATHHVAAPFSAEGDDDVRWSRVDLSEPARFTGLLHGISAVIHCAAMANAAACERAPDTALRINTDGPRNLARACAVAGVRFIHVSTDLVFPGTGGPLDEDAPTRPLGVYGRTKADAELAVQAEHPRALVARTSLLLGHAPVEPRGSDEVLLAQLRRGERPRLFVDEFRTPTHAADLARALVDLLDTDTRGLLHVAGPAHMSRMELGRLICRVNPVDDAMLQPVHVADVPMTPPRAPDTRLATARLRQLAARVFQPRDVESALRDPWPVLPPRRAV